VPPAVTVKVDVVAEVEVIVAGVVAELPDKAGPDRVIGTSKSLAGLSLAVTEMTLVVAPANTLVGVP
jgi:hypothetical protein